MSKHVGAFDPLPAGLDPTTINDDVLRKHGMPPRPDPDLQPQLLEQWNRIMAQPTRFIRAELAIDEAIVARSGRPQGLGGTVPAGPADSPVRAAEGIPIPLGLAGVAREATPTTDYPYPATMVFAEWVVPEVGSPGPDGWDGSFLIRVGLDGLLGEGLHAGVLATYEAGNSAGFRAFIEWHASGGTSHPITVSNFPVKSGDTVSVVLFTEDAETGVAFIRNSRTGMGTSAAITAPSSIPSLGKTTDWMVEPIGSWLPAFGAITFTNCFGGSFVEGSSEYFTMEPGGETSEIEDPNLEDALTMTTVMSPTSAQVSETPAATDWLG
jgi:Peptidase A4 family